MTRRLALALRQYLRRGRPRSDAPAVFVIHRAPIGQALKPIGIRDIVVRYAALAGLAASIRGTHVIRHSVASSLINAGASIKDIADLLGHRSIDTTAIYAKVDLQTLSGVAMPWPGDRQ
jgi:site-specific recombinase XerD